MPSSSEEMRKCIKDAVRQLFKEDLSFELEVYNLHPRSVCDPIETQYELRVFLEGEQIHKTTFIHRK